MTAMNRPDLDSHISYLSFLLSLVFFSFLSFQSFSNSPNLSVFRCFNSFCVERNGSLGSHRIVLRRADVPANNLDKVHFVRPKGKLEPDSAAFSSRLAMSEAEKIPAAAEGVAQSMPTTGAQLPISPQTSTSPPIHDNGSTSSSEKAAEGNDASALEKKISETHSKSEEFGKARIAVIMLSLCIALFLAALDMTIITTALPAIAGHFVASTSDYTWVGSAYLLANAASVPLWGKLSDIWGRKPVILLANVIFLVGSLLCAVSVSIGMLIGGRVVQGVGGGGLIILVNIVISDLFSMRERAKYFGLVGMTWALASAVGPVVGGVFTEKVSWRWCVSSN